MSGISKLGVTCPAAVMQAAKHKPGDGLVEGQLVCPASGACVFILSNASPLWSRIVRFGASADAPHSEGLASPGGSCTPSADVRRRFSGSFSFLSGLQLRREGSLGCQNSATRVDPPITE